MTNILFALALAVWFALLSPVALRGLAVSAPARNDPVLPPLLLVLAFTCLPYLFSVPREDGTAVLDQGLSGSNIATVAITGLTGLYVLARIAADRRVLLLAFSLPYLSFTLALGWDMLSAVWSILPTYTLYRATETATYFLATILIFDRADIMDRLPALLAAILGAWLLAVAPTVLDALSHGIVFSSAKNNL
ncbi:MAG: O-antigen ligase domain-containing protein, partial [Actinomycetospora chiangmaiensis]|nr:O-antigen ligase domain-containing protein [Actinomycetospora chiangmaiensis]